MARTSTNGKTIGARIAGLREDLIMSPAELARKAGISPSTLSRIEAGERDPRPETLRRIGEALGTRLLTGDEKRVTS